MQMVGTFGGRHMHHSSKNGSMTDGWPATDNCAYAVAQLIKADKLKVNRRKCGTVAKLSVDVCPNLLHPRLEG
jgi:hypothetical protein